VDGVILAAFRPRLSGRFSALRGSGEVHDPGDQIHFAVAPHHRKIASSCAADRNAAIPFTSRARRPCRALSGGARGGFRQKPDSWGKTGK